MDIPVIGLGAMGSALARAFMDHGQQTTVWNRSAARADDLVATGAIRAATAADAVAASPLVVVCVLDYGIVRQMARWAAGRGAEYLDGGIMAIPPMIGQADALVLYSGSQAAFQAHEQQLNLLGRNRYLGTDPGLAPLHDLALLCAMYGMLAGGLHAMALVGTEQVKASEFTAMLVPWVNAMTGYLPTMAQQIDSGDYASNVSANLAMQVVAFDNLIEASRTQGIASDLLVPLQALIQRRVTDGHSAEDLAGVIELIRKADAA